MSFPPTDAAVSLDVGGIPGRSSQQREPSLGDTVLYRNSDGEDLAAIITRVLAGGACQLEIFVPPYAQPDTVDPDWGVPQAGEGEPRRRTWRHREEP